MKRNAGSDLVIFIILLHYGKKVRTVGKDQMLFLLTNNPISGGGGGGGSSKITLQDSQ